MNAAKRWTAFCFIQTVTKHFVDMDEVADDMRQKNLWKFEVRECDGHRHRMTKCVTGNNMYQYLRCGKCSIHDKVPVTCYGPKWIQVKRRGEAKSKKQVER